MSWFSNQWNRWNQSSASAWSDVEWLDVMYGRQRYASATNNRYQVSLPRIQGALTLAHLRQELASVFSIPVQQVLVVFQGLFLKDDRVTLQDYGLSSGSRITLLTRDAYMQQARARASAPSQPPSAPQGDAAGGPPPSSDALPSSAPSIAPVARVAHAAPPVQDAGAAPSAKEAPTPMEQIAQVSQRCQRDLVPELEHLETSIDALPDAPPGTLQSKAPPAQADASEDALILPQRIPLTQRKLSELLLRELLKLDGIPTESEEVRSHRKATVKEIQSYLDRVDAAWKQATQAKGIVSDV
ncbi:hypothetical protein MNAN1_003048 [Malassezia nana]|uniref:BAG domain-containing protein n=1 Tax=Malassezia nana TaxID=180528 RepID=A0AAF0EP19_9BASI|nr:hypothetical protein MNAN1_003048 [Malassezia nana]